MQDLDTHILLDGLRIVLSTGIRTEKITRFFRSASSWIPK